RAIADHRREGPGGAGGPAERCPRRHPGRRATGTPPPARHQLQHPRAGRPRSPFPGLNIEFASYREYAPGDDLRRLDWRVFARSDRHYIKQYEEESNVRVTFLVDASASMNYRGPGTILSKF